MPGADQGYGAGAQDRDCVSIILLYWGFVVMRINLNTSGTGLPATSIHNPNLILIHNISCIIRSEFQYSNPCFYRLCKHFIFFFSLISPAVLWTTIIFSTGEISSKLMKRESTFTFRWVGRQSLAHFPKGKKHKLCWWSMQKVDLLNSLSENVGSLVMCQKCIRESQNVWNKIVFQNSKC